MRRKFFLKLFFFICALQSLSGQNPRGDGYKGIWFALGQRSTHGDKYSGGLGTYTSSHIPIAIYSKEVDKTFFVYGGTTAKDEKHLLIMISYFDHKNKTVPRPVIVYDKLGVDDPHDNASMSIDENGYIWVFVSGRNTSRPGLIFKSSKKYDIDRFKQVRQGEMTYPQPWWFKGKGFFYLFTKYTKGRELYWTRSSDGITWETEKKLSGMGGHYQLSNVWKEKLVSVFNYHPNGNVDKRTNVYLVQTNDHGETWRTIDGKILQTPLTDSASESIVKNYGAEGKLVYLNDLNFDKEGNPVILAVVSKDFRPGPDGNPREWTILHWKEKQWKITRVCESTHNYDMGSLYIEGNNWTIIGPTEAGPQQLGTGGEMAIWESFNEGKDWKMRVKLTSNSLRNHAYARRPLFANNDFFAFWADGNADQFSESHLYFTDRNGTAVWELPYAMKKEVESPVKLKK